MFRSAWMMQEILTTFQNEMGSVTLIPSKPPSPGGTFLVKLNEEVIWDRRIEGSFPESKQLKQRVRDKIAPRKDLGHSDVQKEDATDTTSTSTSTSTNPDHCQECEDAEKETQTNDATSTIPPDESELSSDIQTTLNNVDITYCVGCNWMMRSAWTCQELLTSFQEELYSVTLTPSRPPEEGGRFVSTILHHYF